MSIGPLQVDVVHAPTDWLGSVLIPLFAAFFGALAAFLLGWLDRRELQRQTRRELINKTAYSLFITSNTLMNLKRQYLWPCSSEFEHALQIAGASNSAGGEAHLIQVIDNIRFVFNSVTWQDPQLYGLLKPMEEVQFLRLTGADDLAFTVEGDTDLVRFLILIQSQVHQISRHIAEKNSQREKLIGPAQQETQRGKEGYSTLMFYFEMLHARHLLREYVDLALVLIDVATERIDAYRRSQFKTRTAPVRWLLGRERWTTTAIVPDAWKALIPDRADYSDVIDGIKAK